MRFVFLVPGIGIRDVINIDFEAATATVRYDRIATLREFFGEPILFVDDAGITRVPTDADFEQAAAEYAAHLQKIKQQQEKILQLEKSIDAF